MITSTGVGLGSVGGLGMLRARRRDVSVKPNRKLDRKSSRGMIYENEELRLRTININAEVEQGQNDIKKLRRENEQLRREIWCLREEYDKLEEILKQQRNLGSSDEDENDNDDDNNEEEDGEEEDEEEEEEEEDEDEDDENDDNNDDKEDYSDDESISRGSNIEEDEEKNGEKKKINKKDEKKDKLDITDDLIQDELLENAENQKLSTEKSNRLHVEFDQLSIVAEEEESIKKEKDIKECEESCESMVNIYRDGYSLRQPFNWTINSNCPVIPTTNEHSIIYATPAISTMINIDSVCGPPSLPPPSPPPLPPLTIGWDSTIFQGETCNTLTTMNRETCAESIVRVGSTTSSCRPMPRDTSGLSTISDMQRSFVDRSEVNTNITAPSSSSENTTSTIIQKTSPDICIAGCVASPRNYGSTDQLSSNNPRDSLGKSYSCDELIKSNGDFTLSTINQGIEAKSLPDNTNPRAFRSQLKVQLCKLPSDTEMPPKMSPLNWTPTQPIYSPLEPLDRHQHRLLRQLQRHECQATSFECPTPRRLTLPPSMSFQTCNEHQTKSDRNIIPMWPHVPLTLKVVDTQTQTPQNRSSSHSGCSRSGSQSRSSDDQDDKKDTKSTKSRKKMQKNQTKKITNSIRLFDESKTFHEDKTERRSSSSGIEWNKKHQKINRNSHAIKQRRSSRSLSITQMGETPEINNPRDTTVSSNSRDTDKQRKSSITSEKVPWCACWGNGCL